MKDSKKVLLKGNTQSRRKFITAMVTVAGAEILLSLPLISKAGTYLMPDEKITVGQIMDRFIKDVPGGVLKQTVDILKSGSADMEVTGIVTSMFATIEVIRKTMAAGANFIIAHEPTFYNHEDAIEWLKNDHVYQYKSALLKDNNIAVWRCHDYIHRMIPDPVTIQTLLKLGWEKYADKKIPNLITIPSTHLKDLILHCKNKLGIDQLRYIGDMQQDCGRILLYPGAVGRNTHISGINYFKPDVLICGEMSEWETAEYIRDAESKGDKIALIVLGHIASEESCSVFLIDWLKEKFPSIKSQFIPSENSLHFL